MEKAIRLDSDGRNMPLGCRWEIRGGQVVSLSYDPFCEGTVYHYIKPSLTLDAFKSLVGSIICGNDNEIGAEEEILENSRISFKCIYLPLLKCGDKVLALNTVRNDYIIKQLFRNGTMSVSRLENELHEMQEGCINIKNVEIYPIDLSVKEINYLISYYGLDCKGCNFEVIFCPVYLSELTNDTQHFTAVKLAAEDSGIVYNDYTKDNDSFIKSLGNLIFLIAAVLFEIYFVEHWLSTYDSWRDAVTPYIKDYYSIFEAYNEDFHKFCFDRSTVEDIFMTPVFLIVFPVSFVLFLLFAAAVISGIVVIPFLLGSMISGTLFVLYRIIKKNNKLSKYCSVAKIDKSEVHTRLSVIDSLTCIFLSVPIIWPFALIAVLYIMLRY